MVGVANVHDVGPRFAQAQWLVSRCAIGVVSVCLVVCMSATPARPSDTPRDLDQRLLELIDSLGSAQYAKREKAREELASLGEAAFDVLLQSRQHPDVEVRKQVEYLISAIRVAWLQDDEPPEVRPILRDYLEQSVAERESRLGQLANLPDGIGIKSLCRLVRFESSENLACRAALWVMDRGQNQAEAESPAALVAVIQQSLGRSMRPGAQWLRLFAEYLQSPAATVDQWRLLAEAELAELRARPDKERLAILREFLRWQVEMLERQGLHDQAIAAMKLTLPLQSTTRAELLETVDWLVDRSAWSLVDYLAEQFQDLFDEDPYLLYRHAESVWLRDRHDEANEIAARARRLEIEGEPFLHVELGFDLQNRGLFDWAEAEYRRASEAAEAGTHADLEARIRLGWMMHDLGRNWDAYQALKGLIDLVDADSALTRRVTDLQRSVDRVRGQMHFSLALHYAGQNEPEKQLAELDKAFALDPQNADILISMYRVENPTDQRRQETKQLLERTLGQYRSLILLAERNVQAAPSPETRASLAMNLNQSAWLIANTEGDFKEAVRQSRQSLELTPNDAGYLDTLGRCYYAAGDLENAIKTQRRAVELEPHSGQIRRQLQFFEEVAKSDGKTSPSTDTREHD